MRRLEHPIPFGGHSSTSLATHIGLLPSLPRHLACAFWGPNFLVTLLSLGYIQRQGGHYGPDPLRPHTHTIIRASPNGRILDIVALDEANLLPVSFTTHDDHYQALVAHTPSAPPSNPPLPLSAATAARLNAAEALHFTYCHPSDDYLISAISSGSITTSVTASDIRLNRSHRGPCIHCLAGKLREPPHPPSTSPPPTRIGQELTLDIHDLADKSIGGSTTSIRCVDVLTSKFDIVGSKTKTARDILKAILTIVVLGYNAYGHRVDRIYTDSEPVLKALRTRLAIFGIILALAPPLDHARRFERHNQTLTTRCRATLSALPYVLPARLLLQLDAHTAHTINCIPNKQSSPISPLEAVTTTKPPAIHGLFGSVYMVASSIDQRTLLGSQLGLPPKSVDKGVLAVCMGYHPLWPTVPLMLLGNGTIVARRIRSPALAVIPFGWTPKPRTYQPLLPHTPLPLAATPLTLLLPTANDHDDPTPALSSPTVIAPHLANPILPSEPTHTPPHLPTPCRQDIPIQPAPLSLLLETSDPLSSPTPISPSTPSHCNPTHRYQPTRPPHHRRHHPPQPAQ